ncbi:DUF2924 domain-containing protein [Luteolibacter flavescens]|uniref:DUF2924 domain-containing protein n=1 Tax=Luteolibacter flavescens TaxID=1859460 RepID=A0ABT3FHS6_9BACT|nr:DUF2924 domain-containing protein [Luteolibacter flavescens]MCW1883110.1 DUF2924 domain-containing protein [Luteolibacter flavescens]
MQSIEDLEKMTKDELLDRWQKLPGRQPPPGRIDRLLRELAYRLQEEEFGRLDKNTTVSLRRHMAEFGKSLRSPQPASAGIKTPAKVVLEAGSVLTREWDGKRITVQIAGPRQFVWEGKAFKSLSALARKITGQHLSGPLFFGLKEECHG